MSDFGVFEAIGKLTAEVSTIARKQQEAADAHNALAQTVRDLEQSRDGRERRRASDEKRRDRRLAIILSAIGTLSAIAVAAINFIGRQQTKQEALQQTAESVRQELADQEARDSRLIDRALAVQEERLRRQAELDRIAAQRKMVEADRAANRRTPSAPN